jgi:hypothetical protein
MIIDNKMEFLPVVTNTVKDDDDTLQPCIYDNDSYDNFLNIFKELVSADCWALVVDDQMIFNSYQPKSLRNKLLDKIVRDYIIENPHSIFCELFRNKKNSKIVVYMFQVNTWFMVIDYLANNDTFDVKYFK